MPLLPRFWRSPSELSAWRLRRPIVVTWGPEIPDPPECSFDDKNDSTLTLQSAGTFEGMACTAAPGTLCLSGQDVCPETDSRSRGRLRGGSRASRLLPPARPREP